VFPNPQDALPLPSRPNLEQYKKLAKDLVKACKAHGSEAIHVWATDWINSLVRLSALTITSDMPVAVDRWVDQVESFAGRKLLDPEAENCVLADAQFAIARSHGFESWPRFAKHLEGMTRSSSPVSNFESAADAIVEGDVATLGRLLRDDPELIRARSTREHHATLLHYISANGVEGYRQKTPKNAPEIADILLRAGADVNAEADVYGGGATTLGLVATSIHPERAGVQTALMQMLLDHGAAIDHPRAAGNESDAVIGCLANGQPQAGEFLAKQGARLNLEAACGVGRLDVVRSFFNDDGALKPNATTAQMNSGFNWACLYGRKDVVEFLLNKGVDLDAGKNVDQTALHLAAHGGQLEIVNLLLEHGAELEAKNVYGGTVLGQATWSVMHDDQSINFAPIVETLLAAGAKIEEAGYPTGNDRVDELLRRYGAK
jgi:ankyrin repeat protein